MGLTVHIPDVVVLGVYLHLDCFDLSFGVINCDLATMVVDPI